MIARTVTTRKASIAFAVFLAFSVFAAFGVFGEGVAGDVGVDEPAAVSEVVSEAPVVEASEDVYVGLDEVVAEVEEVEGVVDDVEGDVFVELDEVETVEEAGAAGEEAEEESQDLYVDLDDVLEDKGVEDVAEVVEGDVFVELDVAAEESSDAAPVLDQGGAIEGSSLSEEVVEDVGEEQEESEEVVEEEIIEEKELTKSGLVEVAGELERKEIMKITYSEDESDVVDKIERVERVVEESDEGVRKKAVVSSGEDHFEGDIVYSSYLNVEVEDKDQITVNWKDNGEVDFDYFDENDNGLIDRISWTIPHLSEQEFEIIINFYFEDNNETVGEIEVEEYIVPGNVTVSPVEFHFNVYYSDVSLVLCNLSLSDSEGVFLSEEFRDTNGSSHLFDLVNGDYSWDLLCLDETNDSIQSQLTGDFEVVVDYTPITTLDADVFSIQKGESVEFGVNASALFGDVASINYILNYGDGSDLYSWTELSVSELVDSKSHQYNSAGTFTAILNGTVQYEGGEVFVSSDSVTITVSEPQPEGDNDGPDIEMIEPDDEEDFELESREQKIKFSYNVTDDSKIDNCTFEMFYYNNSIFGERIITEIKRDIGNGAIVSYEYKEFDEGDYSWDVECYDNESNRGSVSDRDFYVSYDAGDSSSSSSSSKDESEVKLSAEEQEQVSEVQGAIDAINDFFVEEGRSDADVLEAIADLEIDEMLKLYKKKLLLMKQDLEHNLNYMEEARREERRSEIFEEIREMKKNIPVSFEVLETRNYFKNSLELDLEEVISAYVEAKGIVIDKARVKEMVKQTELLQNQIAVSVNVKKVVVDYFDGGDEEFTLVSKEIDFKSKDFGSLIEVVPKEVAEDASDLSFVVSSNVLKQDPILEIKLSDLGERDKVVYKIKRAVSLEDVEKTTTLAFKEDVPEGKIGGITGFVSFASGGGSGIGFYVSWILAIAGLFVVGTFSYRKVRLSRLKKHKDVRALFEITSEAERLLKKKEIDSARVKYQEAQAIYPKIPENGKRYAYKKLQKLYLAIDKRDIVALVKEFMTASKEGRKDDALMLYRDIQKLYPRMPSGFKEKVFEKMQPHVDRLKWMK
ncbi:MAG: hypothetical protein ABH864_00920 [archaeon]